MKSIDKLIALLSQIDSTKLIVMLALVAVIMALFVVYKVLENDK